MGITTADTTVGITDTTGIIDAITTLIALDRPSERVSGGWTLHRVRCR